MPSKKMTAQLTMSENDFPESMCFHNSTVQLIFFNDKFRNGYFLKAVKHEVHHSSFESINEKQLAGIKANPLKCSARKTRNNSSNNFNYPVMSVLGLGVRHVFVLCSYLARSWK